MLAAICIGNKKKTFNKRMESHFSDVQCLPKNEQKSDSFASHFKQLFKYTTPRTDLHNCMKFRVVYNGNKPKAPFMHGIVMVKMSLIYLMRDFT